MSKVAILTDSNSGITQAQSKDMGVTVIPMPFFIDGVEYLEDINLTQEEFYEKLKNDADISTSQPSIGTLQDYFDELLKDNDEVVFIPMSSGLSGTCQTATMVAGDYDGKVQVVNNSVYQLLCASQLWMQRLWQIRVRMPRRLRIYLKLTKWTQAYI